MNLYGAGVVGLVRQALPSARLEPADEWFRRLDAVKTPREVERLRVTCRLAEQAFRSGSERLRAGLLETEAAAHFAVPLSTLGTGFAGVGRGGGYAWCMSGPNAAEAQGAYARSRPKPVARGELVLVHCNAFADGYWVDVSRTYCLGDPDRRQGALYDAVLAARAAALDAIRPGMRAADVDRAARGVLEERGYGPQFKHPAGHGVGFGAIDHNARPRLHAKSDDVLQAGMVFNVEPAVYCDGECGLRHCDMVAVTEDGHEVLTPFQATLDRLILR
jgi:Xaa-Pro dipeptidase